MKLLAILVALLLPVAVVALAQEKTFEVASIKPSARSGSGDGHNLQELTGSRFGPGTADSTRWACNNCSLSLLLAEAYDLKRFQITGPKWLDSERFDVVAKVAEGATKNDLRLMQQNLLAERFRLKVRLEKKDMQVYDLVVGKDVPKLKEAAAAQPGADGPPKREFSHSDRAAGTTAGTWAGGSHDHAAGRTLTMTMHGTTRHQAVGEDMQQLADFLASQLDKPVTDSTGLTGKYDFLLTFSGGKAGDGGTMTGTPMTGTPMMMHGGAAGGHNDGVDSDAMSQPPLQKAIQDQLGLRLEAKKGTANILIVDQVERVPSEN